MRLSPRRLNVRVHAAASLLHVGGEFVGASPELAGSALWVATANRSGLYFGVAVLVVPLLRREQRMVTRVKEQRDELDELESLRTALIPPDVSLRPQLEVATSFTPAESAQFVTAVCVNIEALLVMRLSWACAGHEAPWYLDTAALLEGGRASVPLGLAPGVLAIEAGSSPLAPGSGFIAFTDGLTEGRTTHRARSTPLAPFGEDRAREIIQTLRGAPPEQVIQGLVGAVTEFAGGPLADDLCIVACRAAPAPRPALAGTSDADGRPTVREPSDSLAEVPYLAK